MKPNTDNMRHVCNLMVVANTANLQGVDFLNDMGWNRAMAAYNGIGPEFLPDDIRDRVTDFLSLFEPAALIHDCRFELSNGSRMAFLLANDEFRHNCIKLANCRYPWYSFRRYRAHAVAALLFDFVSGVSGWKAWLDAAEKNHPSHGAADNQKE